MEQALFVTGSTVATVSPEDDTHARARHVGRLVTRSAPRGDWAGALLDELQRDHGGALTWAELRAITTKPVAPAERGRDGSPQETTTETGRHQRMLWPVHAAND